jgi:Zn-dependent protease
VERFLHYRLEELPFIFIALVIAFTIHEFAHAYLAYKFGDPTAKHMGRVTLDPRKHLDIIGTILILIAGFGWAKPVPVNRGRFKYPRMMGIAVSAAGPLSNLALAFIGLFLYNVIIDAGWTLNASPGVRQAVDVFFGHFIQLNIVLFLFNLIPLPPLDGYRIIEDLAPLRVRHKMSQYEQWGVFIFLLLVFIPPLYQVTIRPLFSFGAELFMGMNRIVQLIL